MRSELRGRVRSALSTRPRLRRHPGDGPRADQEHRQRPAPPRRQRRRNRVRMRSGDEPSLEPPPARTNEKPRLAGLFFRAGEVRVEIRSLATSRRGRLWSRGIGMPYHTGDRGFGARRRRVGDDALALAVIAFGAQLITSFTQHALTTQQSVRSEQLNAETRALLVEMQTTARTTEVLVREQFGRVLAGFMDAAQSADRGKTIYHDELARRFAENMQREAEIAQAAERATDAVVREAASIRARARSGSSSGASANTARRRRESAEAAAFPTEDEAAPVIEVLRGLSESARRSLITLAEDRETSRDVWDLGGLSADPVSATRQELLDRDLIQLVRLPSAAHGPDDRMVHQLTAKGVLAARVLTGSGPVPRWAADLL